MMLVELVLAPGMADSASYLSYPYTNELVNSVIKAFVYIRVGTEDRESFSALGAYGVFDVDVDFHKWLHIAAYLASWPGSLPGQGQIWGCRYRFKLYMGTWIHWISLADFDVDEFHLVSTSPCKFPQLIDISIDGQEARRSRHYPTLPPERHFASFTTALSRQTESVRVSTSSHGTRREINILVLGNQLRAGALSIFSNN